MVTNVLWRNDVTLSITLSHRIGSNKKQSKQSMNADNKLLETVFVIAICCLSDYKQQSKIMLQRSSIALTFSIAAYLVCFDILKT